MTKRNWAVLLLRVENGPSAKTLRVKTAWYRANSGTFYEGR